MAVPFLGQVYAFAKASVGRASAKAGARRSLGEDGPGQYAVHLSVSGSANKAGWAGAAL